MPFAPARGRKGTCGHNGLAATGDAILDLFDLPEITSEAEALEAVRGWGPMLQFVPERLKPPEVCLEAVKSLGTALKFVPKDMKSSALCLLAVQNDALALKCIPKPRRTIELSLCACRRFGGMLQYVPESSKTEEVCWAAVASYGRALLHVPEALKTAPMCLAAATQDGEALRWVPEALLSAELFAEAVRQLGEAPIPVPKRLQSALQSIGPARAYRRDLLDASMDCLGGALAHAVLVMGEEPDAFFGTFIASGLAERFGKGSEPFAGMGVLERDWTDARHASGVQLAQAVLTWRGAVKAWPDEPRLDFALRAPVRAFPERSQLTLPLGRC